jgi:hypothetical protein
MLKQIKKFKIWQTSKIMGLLYLVASALFLIPFSIFMMVTGKQEGDRPAAVVLLLMPVVYGIFACAICAITCAIYNFLASYCGGISFELSDADKENTQVQ